MNDIYPSTDRQTYSYLNRYFGINEDTNISMRCYMNYPAKLGPRPVRLSDGIASMLLRQGITPFISNITRIRLNEFMYTNIMCKRISMRILKCLYMNMYLCMNVWMYECMHISLQLLSMPVVGSAARRRPASTSAALLFRSRWSSP